MKKTEGRGDGAEYIGRVEGTFSEGWIITWLGDLEWIKQTANIVKKMMVIQGSEIWQPCQIEGVL